MAVTPNNRINIPLSILAAPQSDFFDDNLGKVAIGTATFMSFSANDMNVAVQFSVLTREERL